MTAPATIAEVTATEIEMLRKFVATIERAASIACADSFQRLSPHWVIAECKAMRAALAREQGA